MSVRCVTRHFRPVSVTTSAQRNFITFPGTESQSLTATRILPYKSSSVYRIVADVESYSKFVPYCQESKIKKWSSPDTNGKRWPSEADLKVGWGGYEETFTSRLFCVPDSVVEALSGEAVTALPKSQLSHYPATSNSSPSANSIFKSLSTSWTVKPFMFKPPTGRPQTDNTKEPARDRTEVLLTIDFQFSNPIYAALSKAVAPKVAGIMIEAFEQRAKQLLENSNNTIRGGQRIESVSEGKMGA